LGHPKLKNFIELSRVSEGVPKKCGKQEKDDEDVFVIVKK